MTNEGAPRPPDWKELYRLAAMETDPAELPRRVSEARNSILDRIQETLSKPGHYNERQELSDALIGLRTVQQEYESRTHQFGEPRTLRRKAG